MVTNFLEEGAAANVFAKSVGCNWFVVDAGVKGDLQDHPRLFKRKIASGTQNFRRGPAMSRHECEASLQAGRELVADLVDQGVNTFVFGEMGIGNSSSAALLAHGLANIPLEVAIGPGTGVSGKNLDFKRTVLKESWESRGPSMDGVDTLASFGGFEMAMMSGAFLEASQRRCVSLVDGYIASAAALASWKVDPASLDSMIFSHCSKEPGHRALLAFLNQKPILDLELCLGEGTGALLCLPLIRAATDMLNHMATMDGAKVSPKIH
jgi:nicotinate-nucleotide--dimethylbenzimidazole phosphoribosyltransferase